MEQPYLEIQTAAGRRQIVLGRDPVTVGRHAGNQVVVADNMASRFHCVIEATGDGFLLRDLGASNPTRVNGRPVKSVLLGTGDVVTVGRTELVMVVPGAPLEAAAIEDLAAAIVPDDELTDLEDLES
jgi:pSer/pThr/pTyr-binding forkhead associated (FHA) protein